MGLTVISLTSVPPRLRGFLTKYLWEINTGVYVGEISAKVREKLWERCTKEVVDGSRAVLVFPSNNEQGFVIDSFGEKYKKVDFDGIQLILTQSHRSELLPQKQILDEYIVLDCETTGVDTDHDRIIEIGALYIKDHEIEGIYQTLINTGACLTDDIKRLTGITDDELRSGKDIKEALSELGEFIGTKTVIGYNVRNFDAKIIQKECKRNQVLFPFTRVFDILDIVRRDSTLTKYRLEEVANAKGIVVRDKHRALADCYTCYDIYQHYINQ